MGASGSGSRKSRRKQSDPRRLGSDIVIKMEVDIKTEPACSDDDDKLYDVAGIDEEDHMDNEVFIPSPNRTNQLHTHEDMDDSNSESAGNTRIVHVRGLTSTYRSQSQTQLQTEDLSKRKVKRSVDDDDCQPEDLSVGKKKREDNRVKLAIPSAIRPPETPQSKSGGSVSDRLPSLNQLDPPRRFRTLSHDLQCEGSLIALERDYRLKYAQVYEPDSEVAEHVYIPPPPFTISHEHKLGLEADRDSTSPDGQNNGKSSPSTSTSSSSSTSHSSKATKKVQRSYKNLTRSRRIVANARERNRVHTISAAFEGLRRAVPSYSHNQKLSKLAILRIACSYILALAKLADLDYTSEDETAMTFEDCVDMCTETLQAEGRSKRRKVSQMNSSFCCLKYPLSSSLNISCYVKKLIHSWVINKKSMYCSYEG